MLILIVALGLLLCGSNLLFALGLCRASAGDDARRQAGLASSITSARTGFEALKGRRAAGSAVGGAASARAAAPSRSAAAPSRPPAAPSRPRAAPSRSPAAPSRSPAARAAESHAAMSHAAMTRAAISRAAGSPSAAFSPRAGTRPEAARPAPGRHVRSVSDALAATRLPWSEREEHRRVSSQAA